MFTQLSDAKINFYRENGFVQIDNVLTESEVEELKQYVEEVMASSGDKVVKNGDKNYARVLNQRVNTWRDHAGMCKFAFHLRLADLARQLTGAQGIRFFHDHSLWKDPLDSAPTPWHQDLPKWPMVESGALSIWIALEDVDENNGCMMFIPKSHRIKDIKNISLTGQDNIFEYVQGTEFSEDRAVCVPLKAGSCTFHDGLTFHYAHANKTEQPRKSYAIIYFPDGTRFDGKQHVTTKDFDLQKGQPLVTCLTPRLI
ncbi:MAG: phytanoyl-CoA dioxygenase [Bacilli bacterium]|nr:phytanoyl-CoA dioxygenase [Bacilli bacterium]